MKTKFLTFLEENEITEEFKSTLSSCDKTSYKTLDELCSKVDEPEEWVSEGFDWCRRKHWNELHIKWMELCEEN